ncbi:hypothetical protein [Paenibacillus thiaminolyticus]|uniref:hypothetical protein n=1 Tax=Paenibacillus thiaminolyticus TaxID=49283 RepID=UPI002542C2C6|nr:hypothetical protein [Paenibacillus thiaminolyticus]WII40202.1 hypothetical protein O0V01_14445 [Paenibacillus thiaminolyticus]
MNTDSVQLFDASTISAFAWLDTADGRYAKSFLLPLMEANVFYVSASVCNLNI